MAFVPILLLTTSISFISSVTSFSPIFHSSGLRLTTNLFDVIKGETVDAVALDENLGCVGLTNRCAIKISGTAQKGGNADADVLKDLVRYDKMCELNESEAKSAMDKFGCKMVCNGLGKELYYFPDDSVRYEDKVVKLAPEEAAKDALTSAMSVNDAKYVVVNFLGGDDLIYGEVKQACDLLVQELDISEKAKITFNSISFSEFEDGACSVTVVASDGQSSGGAGFEESIARGEVYVYGGKWFTVSKEDITLAEE